MTPEAQRIAIAEAVGWQFGNWIGDCYSGEGWLAPGKTQGTALSKGNCIAWRARELPNFLEDRNAMIEAVTSLTENLRPNLGKNYPPHWILAFRM